MIPTRPRPAPDPPRPLLGLVASIDRASDVAARRSRAVRSLPYLSALVSASCTIRYADTSTPADSVRQRLGHLEIDGESARPERRHQAGQVGEPGRRFEAELVGVVTQHVQQSARLGDRATAGVGDIGEHAFGTVGVLVHEVLRGCRLDDHGADGVGDDVVHVASDAVALVAHRLAADQLLPFLQQLLLVGEATRDPAEDVRRRDQRQHEDHV